MNKIISVCLIIIAFCAFSCTSHSDSSIDRNVKKTFSDWAINNVKDKYRFISITYDTIGCPMDFMFKSTVLGETVGSSGHAESELEFGGLGIILAGAVDSTFLEKDIFIANIKINISDLEQTYYIGIRGDSICTVPKVERYEALKETHIEGEQRVYDACYEIYQNLNNYVVEKGGVGLSTSEDGFYDFWKSMPSYEEMARDSYK